MDIASSPRNAVGPPTPANSSHLRHQRKTIQDHQTWARQVSPRANENFEDPAGRLSRRYWAAFAIVALLLLVSQVVVQPPTLRLLTDAPTINIAGRQRMLSQRIAKSALAMKRATDDAERTTRRDELSQTLAVWTEAHERLGRGEPRVRHAWGKPSSFAKRLISSSRTMKGCADAAASATAR